eukprot:1142672-Pelagomonas_calceolata.AAC.7
MQVVQGPGQGLWRADIEPWPCSTALGAPHIECHLMGLLYCPIAQHSLLLVFQALKFSAQLWGSKDTFVLHQPARALETALWDVAPPMTSFPCPPQCHTICTMQAHFWSKQLIPPRLLRMPGNAAQGTWGSTT